MTAVFTTNNDKMKKMSLARISWSRQQKHLREEINDTYFGNFRAIVASVLGERCAKEVGSSAENKCKLDCYKYLQQ